MCPLKLPLWQIRADVRAWIGYGRKPEQKHRHEHEDGAYPASRRRLGRNEARGCPFLMLLLLLLLSAQGAATTFVL